MRALVLSLALSGLCRAVAASGAEDYVDLVPTRAICGIRTRRGLTPSRNLERQDAEDPEVIGNVTLTGSEQMLWSIGPWGPGANHSTILSLVTYVTQE